MNPQASGVQSIESLLFHTLLQIGLIILVARLAGSLARRCKQPRAVGEIVAGLALGPSLFGAVAPDAFNAVFHAVDGKPLTIISQIGLILLMFQVGLEFDFSHLGERRNRVAAVSITAAGITLPFALGYGFALLSADSLAQGIHPLGYQLFLGVALAITAVPILGRIMMEFGLTRSRVGVITIAAAAANDAIGWVLLAIIATIVTSQFSAAHAAGQIGLLLAFVGISWWVVRPLLRRVMLRFGRGPGVLSQDLLAILLVVIFASALTTSQLGIFAIFGGFTVGVLLHDQHALVDAWKAKVADLVTVFFLPIFFTYTGLRTDIGSLHNSELWGWCALLIGLAFFGKIGGSYLAARLSGLSGAESRNIAIMMNTRALMELIVVNMGYDLGVIPREVFTMLVLMAVISTVLTAPFLRLWLPGIGHQIPVGRDA